MEKSVFCNGNCKASVVEVGESSTKRLNWTEPVRNRTLTIDAEGESSAKGEKGGLEGKFHKGKSLPLQQNSMVEHHPHEHETPKRKSESDFCHTLCSRQGDLMGGRYRVLEKLCQGGFGQVYKALDQCTENHVALKVERRDREREGSGATAAYIECRALKRLDGTAHFPRLYSFGDTDAISYVAMQLLGKNLSDIRRRCSLKPQRVSVAATLGVAVQCLTALQSLHDVGFLHRDVKPSNFAVGGGDLTDRSCIYMIDFGLCRRYVDSSHAIRPPRPDAGFRGTVRYASLKAHKGEELCRADDCLSLFYALVELLKGRLPWRHSNDKTLVAELKSTSTPGKLCEHLPVEFQSFAAHVQLLGYEERPDYAFLIDLMKNARRRLETGVSIAENFNVVKDTVVYDWLVDDCKSLHHLQCCNNE